MNVYVSIGNSDDKLSQSDWSAFTATVRGTLRRHATAIHGEWYSPSDGQYQNACFCIEVGSNDTAELIKLYLGELRETYRQDSVAWAVAETEFL